MAEFFTYQKKRKDFGKPVQFTDTEIKHCGFFPQSKDGPPITDYKVRNPNFIMLDNIAELSEHSVNTERVKTLDKGMHHKEGGWPNNIDPTEPQETLKYKKKIDKDPNFAQSIKELTDTVTRCISQNNQIDLFEEYFLNETSEHVVENLSSKTLLLLKDDCEICKRGVSEISWQPDGPSKMAVSYAVMRFQQMPDKMPSQAYVWDIQNPNTFDLELKSPSPVTNISWNPKILDMIGGGTYNGVTVFWDIRTKREAIISPVEHSHWDPVTHFQWLMSKSGQECVTTSTDGRVLWWDLRQLGQGPVEQLQIFENPSSTSTTGATVLEYNVEAGPNKFLIGTEQGLILTANKKPKKEVEITARHGIESGRHLGPVYALNRNLLANKYFLSVGDWSAKIWTEEIKTPIIRTKYHGAYLSDGMWSPSRLGAFFLSRRDGWMDVWDLYYRQNEIAYSHKVSDSPLTCLKINVNISQGQHSNVVPTGKWIGIGDQDGTVTVLELCESLYTLQPREKDIMIDTYDRECRKEKNLEQLKKQAELSKKVVPKDSEAIKAKWEAKKKEMVDSVETVFQTMLKEMEAQKMEDELADLDSPKNAFQKPKEQEAEQVQQMINKQLQEQDQQQQQIDEGGQQQQQEEQEKQPSQHEKSFHSQKSHNSKVSQKQDDAKSQKSQKSHKSEKQSDKHSDKHSEKQDGGEQE